MREVTYYLLNASIGCTAFFRIAIHCALVMCSPRHTPTNVTVALVMCYPNYISIYIYIYIYTGPSAITYDWGARNLIY